MSEYSKQLLAEARSLAGRDPRRPKQVNLRRAVVAAYYSLFHLLIDECCRFLISGTARGRSRIRERLSRAFRHRDMADAAAEFAKSIPSQQYLKTLTDDDRVAVDARVRRVAEAFASLQEARHQADYDLSTPLTRVDVIDLIGRAKDAHRDGTDLRRTDHGEAFLVCLLVGKQLKK